MAILSVSGGLPFDIYTFSFADIFAEFGGTTYDASTLTFHKTLDPLSSIVFEGVTSYTNRAMPWAGTITSITFTRVDIGQITITDISIDAANFQTLPTINSRAIFANLFSGPDTITADAGLLKIETGGGDDIINASSTDDFIVPGSGTDNISAGLGFDTLDYSNYPNPSQGISVTDDGNQSGSVIDPNGGTDTYSQIERIFGTSLSDTFNGHATIASQNEWVGGKGADVFNGGFGFDTLNFDAEKYALGATSQSGISLNAQTGIVTDSTGAIDEFTGIDAIRATDFADTIIGSNTAEISYFLLAGADIFSGADSNELISPGAGNDTIHGAAGFDTLSYDLDDAAPIDFAQTTENQFVIGGVVVIAANTSASGTVHDQYGGVDQFTGIEHVLGSASADVFQASIGKLTVTGFAGDDVFIGTGGNNMIIDYSAESRRGGNLGIKLNLYSGFGVDSFGDVDRIFGIQHIRATADADYVLGTNIGSDIIFSGAGDDEVSLGEGDDWVSVGIGNNLADGGSGFDQLNYTEFDTLNGPIIVAFAFFGNGWVTKSNGESDTFNEFELVVGSHNDDSFTFSVDGGILTGAGGADTFFGLGIGTSINAVDYQVESSYGGQQAVLVNLSNQAFQFSPTYNLGGNLARDSYGDIDTLNFVDVVRGTAWNDIFVAGELSIFEGNVGNDTYWLNGGGDNAIEKANAGTDKIYTSASMTIPNHIENITLLSGASWAVGNSSNNNIKGNSAANYIVGKLGVDTLTGGSGKDRFVFDTKPASSARDYITDYSTSNDQFTLDRSAFTKIGATSKLAASAFYAGSNAHDASDRIIYNRATGAVYYDPDGTGNAAKIHFATLNNKTALTYLDFDIVA